MSIRKPNNGGRKNLCKFPSKKNGRTILCESLLEKDCCLLMEADSRILAYEEQPLKIEYKLNDELRSHIPDFRVVLKKKGW